MYDQHNLYYIELGWANITLKMLFRPQKQQTPPFEGMGRIYFNLAEFFGPSGRTLFRGPGNAVSNYLTKNGDF